MSVETIVFAQTDVGGTIWSNLTSNGGTINITGGSSLNFEASSPAALGSFCAYLGSGVSNVTGTGTTWTLGTTTALTEVFDIGNVFNTNGTFTAVSAGKYYLEGRITVSGLTALMTTAVVDIVTTAYTYRYNINPGILNGSSLTLPVSAFASMSANDTATLRVTISGGLSDAVDIVGGTPIQTYFSGFRVL